MINGRIFYVKLFFLGFAYRKDNQIDFTQI